MDAATRTRETAREKARAARDQVVTFLWLRWNRVVERWPRLARWLGLRIHLTHKRDQDEVRVIGETAGAVVQAPLGRPTITGGDADQRFTQLESRMEHLEAEIDGLRTWQMQEARDRHAETERERADRLAGDRRSEQHMADLVGGGLRLQAWGVACLLAGTVLTAFW
jgi:hypothetical protein